MLPETLDPDALRTIALVVLAVLVVAAFLVLRMIRKMVLRVVLLGLLAGLGVYVWYERDTLRGCVPDCACSVAGFDVHVAGCPPPDS
jgi:hypothetical protein